MTHAQDAGAPRLALERVPSPVAGYETLGLRSSEEPFPVGLFYLLGPTKRPREAKFIAEAMGRLDRDLHEG